MFDSTPETQRGGKKGEFKIEFSEDLLDRNTYERLRLLS